MSVIVCVSLSLCTHALSNAHFTRGRCTLSHSVSRALSRSLARSRSRSRSLSLARSLDHSISRKTLSRTSSFESKASYMSHRSRFRVSRISKTSMICARACAESSSSGFRLPIAPIGFYKGQAPSSLYIEFNMKTEPQAIHKCRSVHLQQKEAGT